MTLYGLPVNGSPRLSPPLPNCTIRERFDIEAKAPANAISLPPEDSDVQSRRRQIIRQLLADHFGLVLRVQNRTMEVYALTRAGGGAKLQKSAITSKDCAFNTGPQPCHSFAGGLGHPLNGEAITVDDLVRYIENWTDLPVVNRTALKGLFTVKTEGWVPMRLPPPPPGADPNANPFASLPTLFTVLDKLGLELKREKDVMPVYVVEHIKRPITN